MRLPVSPWDIKNSPATSANQRCTARIFGLARVRAVGGTAFPWKGQLAAPTYKIVFITHRSQSSCKGPTRRLCSNLFRKADMDILVLPGDGIGPEITDATLAVLDAASHAFKLNLTFERHDIGFARLKKQGTTMPDTVLKRVPQAGGTILGPVSHYEY